MTDEKEALNGLNVLRHIGRIKKFERRATSNHFHDNLYADGEMYCGDLACSGQCGLPRLIRVLPQDNRQLRDPAQRIQTATALLGVENVWSTYRWRTIQPWIGPVVVVEYHQDDNPVWW